MIESIDSLLHLELLREIPHFLIPLSFGTSGSLRNVSQTHHPTSRPSISFDFLLIARDPNFDSVLAQLLSLEFFLTVSLSPVHSPDLFHRCLCDVFKFRIWQRACHPFPPAEISFDYGPQSSCKQDLRPHLVSTLFRSLYLLFSQLKDVFLPLQIDLFPTGEEMEEECRSPLLPASP